MRALLLPLVFSVACAPSYIVSKTDDTGIEGPSEEELDALWGEAELQILSPLSGEFIPLEEEGHFEAVVVDAEGEPMDFEEITWSTDVDEEWSVSGAMFDQGDLEVGTHAFTAVALLPNGDRLRYTVGGVLVQSSYAGTYAGTLSINTEIQGYQIGCSGASTLLIDPTGETLVGGAGCNISLQGFDIDLNFNIDAENDEGDIEGFSAVDIFGFEYPLEMTGEVTPEGDLLGGFDGEVAGGAFSGELSAVRISRDTSGDWND